MLVKLPPNTFILKMPVYHVPTSFICLFKTSTLHAEAHRVGVGYSPTTFHRVPPFRKSTFTSPLIPSSSSGPDQSVAIPKGHVRDHRIDRAVRQRQATAVLLNGPRRAVARRCGAFRRGVQHGVWPLGGVEGEVGGKRHWF